MAGNLVTWLCGDEGHRTNNDSQSFVNDSLVATNSTAGEPSGGYSGDPMLYIVVVLLFYAGSITLMMVKYIRKQSEEKQLDSDFNTFVKREGFDEQLMEAKNVAAMRIKEIADGKKKPLDRQEEVLISAV